MYPKKAKLPKEVTLRARAVLEGDSAYYFYLPTAGFRAGVIKALDYVKNGVTSITALYKVAYSIIGNRRYADEAVLIMREILESTKALGIPLDKVKLRD